MQIAQVVVKTRTTKEEVFDYAIPPGLLPTIKRGVLVMVPFHGRKIEGIIVNLKRTSLILNLKSLISVIDPNPVVDDIHIKLAQWMADYYLSPLSKTLFENIVPPAKRIIKKQDKKYTIFIARAEKIGESKKYIVVADFNTRLQFYLAAIRKTLAQNKSAIILVPDLSLLPFFTKHIKNPFAVLHSSMTKTQRWLEWDKIRQGKVKVVIGSQSALFAPAANLGLIIIDQEENETYKNDRSPRFQAADVAYQLSKLTGANLVLGSITPKVETYHRAISEKFRILKKSDRTSNIAIVDMNSEKYLISNRLEDEIEDMLKNRQKTLLVLNRKGEGTKFSCPDCGWIAACEKCGLPLIPQKAGFVCFRCEKKYPLIESCPKCQSIRLKPFGLGTARLKKFLEDLFPLAKIIQIEKELDSASINNWDIAIVTSYALKSQFPQIGLVGIIDADQGLNFPDFNSPQKTFQTLYKFLRLGSRGVIQTHLPENLIIRDLGHLDYEKFFLDEIALRKKYDFPPFIHLIRLLYKNADEEKVKEETSRVHKILSIYNAHKQYAISPPYAPFIEKERSKFKYQIAIKTARSLDNKIKKILRTLPKGWIVDIDPVNLL